MLAGGGAAHADEVGHERAYPGQVMQSVREVGYAVDVASNGVVRHFQGDTEPYGAVVLDPGLPQMDGLTVLRKWRAAGRTMSELILSDKSIGE
jgi:two-component system OmpR family response regulator